MIIEQLSKSPTGTIVCDTDETKVGAVKENSPLVNSSPPFVSSNDEKSSNSYNTAAFACEDIVATAITEQKVAIFCFILFSSSIVFGPF
ncbi:hypothetical protein [Parasphingorhabdus sp.]|uniref:hypothetical protein n=1 Tax=Parasphingorhabdus sp. TaxID=2709688 RepID=UPI0032656340